MLDICLGFFFVHNLSYLGDIRFSCSCWSILKKRVRVSSFVDLEIRVLGENPMFKALWLVMYI